MKKIFKYLWASPATCLGLIAVGLSLGGGGRVAVVRGVIEACGPHTAWLLRHMPFVRCAAALTLGHVVLACDQKCLDTSREHERIHVRQYERWGPFFIPAYLGYGLINKLGGRDPYYDNPFEKEAFLKS